MNRFFCVAGGLLMSLCGAWAADSAPNLLSNGDLERGEGHTIPAWTFKQQGSKGELEYGVSGDAGQRGLFIRKLDNLADDNVWWFQKAPIQEGQTYRLQFEARGSGGANHFVSVGADFLAADGHYLGYKELQRIAYRNPAFPSATVPDVPEWKSYDGQLVVPPGVAWVQLRLALGGTTTAEAGFRALSLTQSTVSVAQVLEKTPPQIPAYAIPLAPVAAEGVTLTPDWTWTGADTLQSATRWKASLNGLWAIQPALDPTLAPRPGDWAFFKVPGYFAPQNPYAVYGRDKTSWGPHNVETTSPGIWYVRDVEIPSCDGKKVFFEVGGMFGLAVRVYWNGQAVGEVTDQMQGRVDLTPYVHPGKGQLAIYALAQKPEHQYAFLEETGVMPRLHPPDLAKAPWASDWSRGFHDLYLSMEPAQPVLDRVEALPSLKGEAPSLGLRVLTSSSASERFRVRVSDADGKSILDVDAGTGTRDENGVGLAVPWPNPHLWTPDDPYLYTFQVQALGADGALLDETLPERLGFREIRVEGKQILFNGHPFHLRPKLNDIEYMDDASIRRQFALLKDMGFNCVQRPFVGETHEMEDMNRNSVEAYYGIADEMGMLVIPYTPYNLISGGQFGSEVISSDRMQALFGYIDTHQIRRLFNHPSVVAYSGFGDIYNSGINTINFRPDVWGIHPLDAPGFLEGVMPDAGTRDKALRTMASCRSFISGIKRLDPTRPFLSHLDSGEGDGWGGFDYFNWTPLQEWEDWPQQWASEGKMPMGSTEHGLPFGACFLNHAPVGGDGEPWITEYSAGLLGDQAYLRDTPEYLDWIRSCYDPAVGNYLHGFRAIHQEGEAALLTAGDNIQAVWAVQNRAIYRTWRTYGVSMGIEPFGNPLNLIQSEAMMRDNGKIVADPRLNLKTIGPKLDRWICRAYMPRETMPFLSPVPTGKKPSILTPLGDALYQANSPLLAYIAGAPPLFSAKDHVYWSGETVVKQVAVAWDGFTPRNLVAAWQATLDGKVIASGTLPLSLTAGQISLTPFQFSAPAVATRAEGVIHLSVKETGADAELIEDDFPFQVYGAYHAPQALSGRKIALFDPSGESSALFQKLNVPVSLVTNLDGLKDFDLVVLGRRALDRLAGTSLAEKLPPGTPVLILEQDDRQLAGIGLRAFPIRERVLFPMPGNHPVLNGVGAPDLRDWRVTPGLLPAGIDPLRNGYDYHNGYNGAAASVTIEIPTRGGFTPLLRSGFDLRETPLLEADAGGRRIVFCQLSLVDGVGIDPVATRLAANILDYMTSTPSPKTNPLSLVGDAAAAAKWETALGIDPAAPIDVSALSSQGIALILHLPDDPAAVSALSSWVAQGGTAVVLPQPVDRYSKYLPNLGVESRKASLVPWSDLPQDHLLFGLGQNNFHYRQPLDQLFFQQKGNVAEVSSAKGKWVFLGFNPDGLDVGSQPYLRLTQRNQYRALSQILTNLGADLSSPVLSSFKHMGQPSESVDLGVAGTAVIAEAQSNSGNAWTNAAFDDSRWISCDLKTEQTPFGKALIRIRFKMPSTLSDEEKVLDLGTIDDYDETYLNGVRIGGVTPENSSDETTWTTHRLYPIPAGLLKPGQSNVIAISAWNRNADAKGWKTWLRGPVSIHPKADANVPYVGSYKLSDDPYLERHW